MWQNRHVHKIEHSQNHWHSLQNDTKMLSKIDLQKSFAGRGPRTQNLNGSEGLLRQFATVQKSSFNQFRPRSATR